MGGEKRGPGIGEDGDINGMITRKRLHYLKKAGENQKNPVRKLKYSNLRDTKKKTG